MEPSYVGLTDRSWYDLDAQQPQRARMRPTPIHELPPDSSSSYQRSSSGTFESGARQNPSPAKPRQHQYHYQKRPQRQFQQRYPARSPPPQPHPPHANPLFPTPTTLEVDGGSSGSIPRTTPTPNRVLSYQPPASPASRGARNARKKSKEHVSQHNNRQLVHNYTSRVVYVPELDPSRSWYHPRPGKPRKLAKKDTRKARVMMGTGQINLAVVVKSGEEREEGEGKVSMWSWYRALRRRLFPLSRE